MYRTIEEIWVGVIPNRPSGGKYKLSNKRVYPAVDVIASGTRREDLLLPRDVMNRTWVLRKYLSDMNPVEAMEFLQKQMSLTDTNEEFLATMNH